MVVANKSSNKKHMCCINEHDDITYTPWWCKCRHGGVSGIVFWPAEHASHARDQGSNPV